MRHVRERSGTAADCNGGHHAAPPAKDFSSLNGISLGHQCAAAACGGADDGMSSHAAPSPTGKGGNPSRRHVEVLFHPELRRTKEVIRRPDWVRRAGEGVAHRGSLSTVALFGIMFANCVGGGYGFEDGIGSAGPLITLIVCVLLPWIWAFPTGLAVAELSTAVPSNSGVLMWANAAFPPFISFMCILATIFITFIGNATYPNLTAEYAQQLGHLSAAPVAGVKVAVVVLCCVLNCVGVEIVGGSSIILCSITILPFMLLVLIQLFSKGFNKAVLYVDVKNVQWADFFSIISWNYANIENAGAVVEEVANPRRAFPKAMVMLMLSTYVGYVMPMLAGVSAMGVDQDYNQWVAGHWPDVAKVISGDWLKYLLFAGAMLSGVGFTLTSMCCTSRLLAGMGTMQMFPKKISRVIGYYHPRLGTPMPAIIINSVVTLVFSVSLDFTSVVSLCQSIYCLRMLLIYASLIKLRIDYPNLPRPYALPFNTWKTTLILLPAAAFSLMASIVSAMTSLAIGMALVGFVVVGSGVSWVYCRIFAPNGFQGVIVQCEVSSGDDADGIDRAGGPAAAADGAPERALSEGVFYMDDNAHGEEPVDDLLLGVLPLPAASVAENGAASQPRRLRRGTVDHDSVGSRAGEEMVEVEYMVREGDHVADAMYVNGSGRMAVSGSAAEATTPRTTSPTRNFAPYGRPGHSSAGSGPTMRRRRRTRSLGANGGGSGRYTSAASGAEESDSDGDEAAAAADRSGSRPRSPASGMQTPEAGLSALSVGTAIQPPPPTHPSV